MSFEQYDQKIVEKVISVVAEVLKIDPAEIKPDSNYQNDLGAASLDMVVLLMTLEDEFDDDISEEEAAEKLTTVEDTIKFISERVGGSQ